MDLGLDTSDKKIIVNYVFGPLFGAVAGFQTYYSSMYFLNKFIDNPLVADIRYFFIGQTDNVAAATSFALGAIAGSYLSNRLGSSKSRESKGYLNSFGRRLSEKSLEDIEEIFE